MMKQFLFACLVSIMVFAGCTAPQKAEEKTAAQLLEEGLSELDNSNPLAAIEVFTKIKDWYPFSKHAVTAELKSADARYELKEYDAAIFSYGGFVNLHPRNEAVPYAIFQIGNCYLDQLRAVDQDQSNAKKAHANFLRLLKQFPDTEYKNAAEVAIKTCRKSIVAHEVYVAKFYLKVKLYKAALHRFKAALNMYPDIGAQHEALTYMAQCEAAIVETPPVETPALENTESAED